ncbi:MAG: DUF1517 domain-containing protein [Nodosilinea sp.]
MFNVNRAVDFIHKFLSLLVYKLLWTPQVESDSFSYDDLIANYPALVTL